MASSANGPVSSAPRWLVPAARRVDLATREGRIKALGEAALALLEGKHIDQEVAVFLGAALLGWLGSGGDLERDHLKASGPAGSHRTPAWIWNSASSRGQQDTAQADSLDATSNERERKC
jgi:hypothetical protein